MSKFIEFLKENGFYNEILDPRTSPGEDKAIDKTHADQGIYSWDNLPISQMLRQKNAEEIEDRMRQLAGKKGFKPKV